MFLNGLKRIKRFCKYHANFRVRIKKTQNICKTLTKPRLKRLFTDSLGSLLPKQTKKFSRNGKYSTKEQ